MDILVIVIALALTIFVVVALGQLFAIKHCLERLVQLAQPPLPEGAARRNLSDLNDADLMAKYKATASGQNEDDRIWNAAALQELKTRGYYMGD